MANGIPSVVVGRGQTKVPVLFQDADECAPGPYPIPLDAPIEGDARHGLVIGAAHRRL